MSTSIHEACTALWARNCEPAWVWSMLLGQGLLTWDNVWDAFPGGVSSHSRNTQKTHAVPSPHTLLSLPKSPTNIVEVFQRLAEIEQKYPYHGQYSYESLTKQHLSENFLQATHGFVQCTWPQIKEVLDFTQNGTKVVDSNLLTFFNLIGAEHPKLLDRSLVYMMQTQHGFTQTHDFGSFVHARNLAAQIWEEAKTQQWATTAGMSSFLDTYALSGQQNGMCIPAMEALAFIEKHPSMLKDMAQSIVSHGARCPEDDHFFAQANSMFLGFPEYSMELAVAMKRSVPLTLLQGTNGWEIGTKSVFELKPLLQAYVQMDAHIRDSKEAAMHFARLFSCVKVHTEDYMNGHSNDLMTDIMRDNATGSVGRILALHACIVGLYPNEYSDKAIKQLKSMFKHDPRSKSGFASILNKCIPDMKVWLGLAQSIGLSADDIWTQGLQQLVKPLLSVDLELGAPIDVGVFDS